MKKIKKVLLFLIICCSWFNVLAEPTTEDETKKSSDATLKDVYINDEKVVCSNYVCEKIIEDNDVKKVIITYKVNDEKATVAKEKLEVDLKDGLNEFKVKVTAEDETVKEYTFKINKKVLSTDSSLKKINVNGEEVTLKSGVTKYNVSVSYAAKKIEIEATPNNASAKIDGFKNNKISYDFFDDTKEIKIKVIAEAGDVTTYILNVSKREEKNTDLKSLTIKNVKLNFESGVYDYEITVVKSFTSLEIVADAVDQNAKVTVNGGKNLEIGDNTVTILVENDGNSKTYTLNVKRLESEDKTLTNLKSLKIEKYELDFKEDKYEYDLKIGDDNYLVIEALPLVDTCDVSVTGNLDLVDGSVIKIKVSYDDDNYNIYKINIIKEVSKTKENNTSKLVIIIVIALILTAIIVLLVIQLKNRKNKDKNNENNKNDKNDKNDKNNINLMEDEKKEEVKEEIKSSNLISISDDSEIEDII